MVYFEMLIQEYIFTLIRHGVLEITFFIVLTLTSEDSHFKNIAQCDGTSIAKS